MKRIIAKYNHYKSVLHVLHKYESTIASVPALKEYAEVLSRRVNRMTQILHEISIPVSLLYSQKQNAENMMIEAVKRFGSLGFIVASHKQDEVMMFHMKLCVAQLHKVSAYRMMQNALQIAGVLEANEALIESYGIKRNKLNDFRNQIHEFGIETETLQMRLLRRKSMRSELAALIAETNIMLHISFDSIAEILSRNQPDFYREYKLIRKPNPRKKRTVKKKEAAIISPLRLVALPAQNVIDNQPQIKDAALTNAITAAHDTEALIPESFLVELFSLTESGFVFGNTDN